MAHNNLKDAFAPCLNWKSCIQACLKESSYRGRKVR